MTILLLILVVGIAVAIVFGDQLDEIAPIIFIISIVGILMLSLIWIVTYQDGKAKIIQYHIFKTTVENMKADGVDLSDAAINVKILEANAILAKAKYWNGTIFEQAIPDELADLPYLK